MLFTVLIREIDDAFFLVEQRNIRDIRFEYRTELLTNEIDEHVQIKFRYKCSAYGVDRGKFTGAVLGFVEEAGIFNRNTHGIGQSLKQLNI